MPLCEKTYGNCVGRQEAAAVNGFVHFLNTQTQVLTYIRVQARPAAETTSIEIHLIHKGQLCEE